jgi:hypothetical protein
MFQFLYRQKKNVLCGEKHFFVLQENFPAFFFLFWNFAFTTSASQPNEVADLFFEQSLFALIEIKTENILDINNIVSVMHAWDISSASLADP